MAGTFQLRLSENITPYVSAKAKLSLSYQNLNGIQKTAVTGETAEVLAGTPTIVMSMDSTNNSMMPGETRNFTVKVVLTKMRSPIRFEVFLLYFFHFMYTVETRIREPKL